MTQKENMSHFQLVKKGGKLVHTNSSYAAQYNLFVDNLAEEQIVDCFMDANVDDGSLAQLAKIHACIKQIAKETGSIPSETKLDVKRMAGLCVKKEVGGDQFLICRSFSKCSKSELGLVIETIIQIGDTIGVNFR